MASEDTVKLVNPYQPTAYELHVNVNLSKWSYEAQEKVTLKRNEEGVPPGDLIQLHAAPTMEILSVEGAVVVKHDPTAETLHLRLPDYTAAEHVIAFAFRHSIQEGLRGFYRVKVIENGKEHRMASTHFEPTSARLFYICQDEPARRADFTFTVTLPTTESDLTVLSNGPLKSKEVVGSETHYRFDTVPKCPPYLTACVIGMIGSVEGSVNGIPVRVFATVGKVDRAKFALKTVLFALDFFTTFFKSEYPLSKLDVVAVPDFPVSGMENWGCINCSESILVDEASSSVSALKRASLVLCHEVSHNWFGNLVAINWWDSLWLKEGFASWCGNFASDAQNPSWKVMEDAARQVASALEVDMYENSHPVEVPIRDPGDITQIFDTISYDKGMGLVIMLEAYLGPANWSTAVAHYINKFKYKDTKTAQLWEALEESSQQPVANTMNTFTTQTGYPMIHVTRKGPTTVSLRQEPCKFSHSSAHCDQVWSVPIVLEGKNEGTGSVRLILQGKEDTEVELSKELASGTWLTANPQRKCFYRCRYDDVTFKSWVSDYANLTSADRRALISDTFAGINMGLDDGERLLAVAAAVRSHETKLDVLSEYVFTIRSFASSLGKKGGTALRRSQLGYFLPLAEAQLQVTPKTDDEKRSKSFYLGIGLSLVRDTLSAAEVEKTPLIPWAKAQAAAFFSNGDYMPDKLSSCLEVYIRLDSQDIAEKNAALFAKLQEVDGDDELSRAVIFAICMSPDTNFVKDVAMKCMTNNGVRSHLGGNIFSSMASNPSFAEGEVWHFFQENFALVKQLWGEGQFRIQLIVSVVGSTLSGLAAADEFESFFKEHPLPIARLVIGRAAEDIRQRSWKHDKWLSKLMSILPPL